MNTSWLVKFQIVFNMFSDAVLLPKINAIFPPGSGTVKDDMTDGR
jgi:hypothetical protein